MPHKAILGLFAVIVIGSMRVTAASAHGGGGGDYPSVVGYPFVSSFSSEHVCHVVQQRVLTRHGWRVCPVRICG
jgi:hypothetical protein